MNVRNITRPPECHTSTRAAPLPILGMSAYAATKSLSRIGCRVMRGQARRPSWKPFYNLGPPPRFVTRSRVGQAPAGAREQQGRRPDVPCIGPSGATSGRGAVVSPGGRATCSGSFLCYECSAGQRDFPGAPTVCPLRGRVYEGCRFTGGSLYRIGPDCRNSHHRQPPPVPAHQAPAQAREGRHHDRSTRSSGSAHRL